MGQCFASKAAFDQYCTTYFSGVTDGHRCYFAADVDIDWISSFAACARYGAKMIQPHTLSEYMKITDYANVSVFSWFAFWFLTDRDLGMQKLRNAPVVHVPLPLKDLITGGVTWKITNTTFFTTDGTTPDPTLQVTKTWLYRYNGNKGAVDIYHEPAPRCLVMFHYNSTQQSFAVGDIPCSGWNLANIFTMCEFSSKSVLGPLYVPTSRVYCIVMCLLVVHEFYIICIHS